ncbi:hypothetical protein RUM44_000757 [Polyplax serrata]|uniref:Tight junction protein ZO-1-like n=1 Tax=Polyplax serrata TaxID=468196 RepID=A0ABR1B989_POLSC
MWETHQVTLSRVPGYGFGIAVSGGRDNPHFANGDPSIAISDVLKAGPAEGKLMVNDCIVSANGVSLENVEYARAVQVLRDSGHTVALTVRRKITLPAPQPHTLRVQLNKTKKKDDFGLVLGCRIYVREFTRQDKDNSIQEGDILLKINNHSTDGLSVKEARKLIENSKDKLSLVVKRERRPGQENTPNTKDSQGNYLENLSGANYPTQNLYVQPPTRHSHQQHFDDKSNLAPRGRSRGPLLNDVSLSQLDRPSTPQNATGNHHVHSRSRSGLEEPPRPPPPRSEGKPKASGATLGVYYYTSRRQLYEEDLLRSKHPVPDPRFISFQKEGSVGIRLTGGNESGIFVTAVQPGSPASLQGLQPGDKILKVNDMDMKGVTREEAVLFLLSLQDQIDLIVQHRMDEYEQVVQSQRGDSFYVKAHFNYDQPNKGEMCFRKGDVFRVVDTLHNGVVGSWQVFRIGRNNQEVQKGIIPNKARAEELATAQFNATKKELSASESRGSFFRRRRNSHRRSKSLSRDHWDDVVFSDSISKFPAYERVVLRHPGFIRPVVLFGPVADIARDKILKDFSDKFTSPQLDNTMEDVPKSQKSSGIIRLSAIRDIMDRNKHALLDITPNAVDRLNYAQFYPIVIFLKAETKHVIKELRSSVSKGAHKSSKKLLEQCQKLEKVWGHTFSCSITLTSPESWYRKLRELIDKQQTSPVWMSETKPVEFLSDMYLRGVSPPSRFSDHPEFGIPPYRNSSSVTYISPPEPSYELLSPVPHSKSDCCINRYSPEEALSDDFLFPMTSRFSYASSPESDLDLSPEPRSGLQQTRPRGMVKSSSDPSIATQDDIPSYNAPPPYAPPNGYQQMIQEFEYGRTNGTVRGSSLPPEKQHDKYPLTPPDRQAAPELPPRIDRTNKPPRANITVSRTAQERLFGKDGGPPSPTDPPNYINATPHMRAPSSSLERHNNVKTQNSNSYDSMSSYDSYNNRFGPNAHDDLKSNVPRSHDPSPRSHDPYRFTRSTAQPLVKEVLSMGNSKSQNSDYQKYRGPEYGKPAPPPKTANHKPVPPPKPKNYRPPQQPPNDQQWNSNHHSQNQNDLNHWNSSTTNNHNHDGSRSQWRHPASPPGTLSKDPYQHSKSYSLAGGDGNNYSHSIHHNGNLSPGKYSDMENMKNDVGSPAMSPGRGSQYYYNMSPHNRQSDPPYSLNHNGSGHNREVSGLDLANREQRGSAFELYKKPHYLEHNIRDRGVVNGKSNGGVVATARGIFTHEGGILESQETGVSLRVPPGAIPHGVQQEIYFKVCRANEAHLPPLDADRGETLLSPLVMCGPQGLKFGTPVELRLPHRAANDDNDWSLALQAGSPSKWQKVVLDTGIVDSRNSNSVSVMVDHF